MTRRIEKTPDEWKALLRERGAEPVAYQVTREHGTERPFTGRFENVYAPGRYHCICCDKPLFASDAKFDAGCGWPSFDRPLAPDAVEGRLDTSHGMRRTEVLCPDCGAHLGHVFDDGPTDTGLRYCMNSASLHFSPE